MNASNTTTIALHLGILNKIARDENTPLNGAEPKSAADTLTWTVNISTCEADDRLLVDLYEDGLVDMTGFGSEDTVRLTEKGFELWRETFDTMNGVKVELFIARNIDTNLYFGEDATFSAKNIKNAKRLTADQANSMKLFWTNFTIHTEAYSLRGAMREELDVLAKTHASLMNDVRALAEAFGHLKTSSLHDNPVVHTLMDLRETVGKELEEVAEEIESINRTMANL